VEQFFYAKINAAGTVLQATFAGDLPVLAAFVLTM